MFALVLGALQKSARDRRLGGERGMDVGLDQPVESFRVVHRHLFRAPMTPASHVNVGRLEHSGAVRKSCCNSLLLTSLQEASLGEAWLAQPVMMRLARSSLSATSSRH